MRHKHHVTFYNTLSATSRDLPVSPVTQNFWGVVLYSSVRRQQKKSVTGYSSLPSSQAIIILFEQVGVVDTILHALFF